MTTNIANGADQAQVLQAVGLFTANMQRPTNMNRLSGEFPDQTKAESNLRNQTSIEVPIVRCKDLAKTPGDEITFDFVNPTGGKPIMGSRMAQGRGVSMVFDQDRLRIDQSRYVVSGGNKMSQKRTKHQLRKLALANSFGFMDRCQDQRALIHMAGSRGFHDTVEWAVPLASDPDFADIMVNAVLAPTNNRHYLAAGNYIEKFNASGSEVGITTTDVLNMGVVDSIASLLDEMPLAPGACKFKGDVMASDSPIRILLVSSAQYSAFATQATFRTLQAQAYQRASAAGNLALFRGDVGLWNGVMIVKMPKPIRFYAGNAINWCATASSETETTTDLVPASFTAGTYAVDRMLLLGAQALAEGYGSNATSGVPFFFEEEETDFKDKLEVMCGLVDGKSKVRFDIDHGPDGVLPTDFGVIAIDTAVHL
jgi:N4-gp56 family major capsid protein